MTAPTPPPSASDALELPPGVTRLRATWSGCGDVVTVWAPASPGSRAFWRCSCCGRVTSRSQLEVREFELEGAEWFPATGRLLAAAGEHAFEAADPEGDGEPADTCRQCGALAGDRVHGEPAVQALDVAGPPRGGPTGSLDEPRVHWAHPAENVPACMVAGTFDSGGVPVECRASRAPGDVTCVDCRQLLPWRGVAVELAQAVGSAPEVQRTWLPGDDLGDLVEVLRARLEEEMAKPHKGVLLCSQCGEAPSAMVKIGTDDGWCTGCLDAAAEPGPITVRHGRLLRGIAFHATRSLVEAYEVALEGGYEPGPDERAEMSQLLEEAWASPGRRTGSRCDLGCSGAHDADCSAYVTDDAARDAWLTLASRWYDHQLGDAWDRGEVLPELRRIVELADASLDPVDEPAAAARPGSGVEPLCGSVSPSLTADGPKPSCRKPFGHVAAGDRAHTEHPDRDPDTTFTWQAARLRADGLLVRVDDSAVAGQVFAMCATPDLAAAVVDLWNRYA